MHSPPVSRLNAPDQGRGYSSRALLAADALQKSPALFIFLPEPGEGEVAGEPDEREGWGRGWEVGGVAAGEVADGRAGSGRQWSLLFRVAGGGGVTP